MPQASDPIAAGVIDVIKNVSRRPVEPALASALVADLGFDSLQLLELVAELEDRFDVAIPATSMPAITTVADIVDALARLLDGGAAGR